MHAIVPARVAVAEIGLVHEAPVRDVDQVVRNGDADVHAFGFVAPLILAGPPGRRAVTFVRGVDPVLAGRIGPEGQRVEPAVFARLARVVKLDRVGAAGCGASAENRRRPCCDRACTSASASPIDDLLDGEVREQLQLDARVVLEHLEADGVLAADPLLLGIDPDVEVVIQQVVVGAIAAVFAAQNVGACRRAQRRWWRRRRWFRLLRRRRRRGQRTDAPRSPAIARCASSHHPLLRLQRVRLEELPHQRSTHRCSAWSCRPTTREGSRRAARPCVAAAVNRVQEPTGALLTHAVYSTTRHIALRRATQRVSARIDCAWPTSPSPSECWETAAHDPRTAGFAARDTARVVGGPVERNHRHGTHVLAPLLHGSVRCAARPGRRPRSGPASCRTARTPCRRHSRIRWRRFACGRCCTCAGSSSRSGPPMNVTSSRMPEPDSRTRSSVHRPGPDGYATMNPSRSATRSHWLACCCAAGHSPAPCMLITSGMGLLPS